MQCLGCERVVTLQALTLNICIHWPRGPVDLKSYWPTQKVTGPNPVNKICCYQGARRITKPTFDRSDILKIFRSSMLRVFF